jgi:D-beta-D-heptose 7-phosphate kinase/D-beta-D-heptose 1-phosphate adenosyltransferase
MDSDGKPTVLVVGDLMLDRYVHGVVARVSPEAPVPILRVEHVSYRAGGAGSATANLLALGAHVICYGGIGDDRYGDTLCNLLIKAGADLTPVQSMPDGRTIVKTRYVARQQQLLRVDTEPAAPNPLGLTAEAVVDYLDEADSLLISDYAKGAIDSAWLPVCMMEAQRRAVPVVVDPSRHAKSLYAGPDIMTPNRAEACALVQVADEHEAGCILARHCRLGCILTLDGDGMEVYSTDHEPLVLPAERVEVYDVTGAGDMVSAVLAFELACGTSIEDAARKANHAAAIEVTKLGATPLTPKEIA